MERLSIPGPGRTISAAVEERAKNVRRAVEVLAGGVNGNIAEAFSKLFEPDWVPASTYAEPKDFRAAWALVNILLLARLQSGGRDFQSAEEWFFPGRNHPRIYQAIEERALREAELIIDQLTFDEQFEDLLPYILESHGPGSRLSVMKDPSTHRAREVKKQAGVFYTPADVADYIVTSVHKSLSSDAKIIDPCCGTGVFLLACLSQSGGGLEHVVNHLYGIDISSLSVECCAFVLLHACRGSYNVPHWFAWHLIRTNLRVHDSLQLRDWPVSGRDELTTTRGKIRRQLWKSQRPTICELTQSENSMRSWKAPNHRSIWELFPEVEDGFDALVGNPPYTQLGSRKDGAGLEEYKSLPTYSPTANTYPLFIEMAWQFTNRNNSRSGLVVPLSIAYHQGRQYTLCRRAMRKNGGNWRFLFFDREPHALFGEDVKTRNAIIFHEKMESQLIPRLSVTPLLKWTSRTRSVLFDTIHLTDLGDLNFEKTIPKLGSQDEAVVLEKLLDRSERLSDLCKKVATYKPSQAVNGSPSYTVFVASTAYNFLNVFRPFKDIDTYPPLSENKIHGLTFANENDACLAFAILSSRISFWLWHTLADGFHVSRRFLESISFDRQSFALENQSKLENLGSRLWDSVQAHRVVSVNRGRRTVAFKPLACSTLRDEIDTVLVDTLCVDPKFTNTLRKFVEKVVVVDASDERRKHFKNVFKATEVLT